MRLYQLKDSNGLNIGLYRIKDPEISRIKIDSLFKEAFEESFAEEQEEAVREEMYGECNFDFHGEADKKLEKHGIERVFIEASYCTNRL